MNRRKKIITKFNNKDKRANAKLHKSNKPAYISKAERAKLAEQDAEQAIEHGANEVVQTSV
ncbi:hypothetical protein BG00_04790 [Pseudoalteromonas sp. SCSIO_11900]|jgi:hypothetical protein|uniref:DUF2986 domain-containing protein n=1 Tax=Pseudoalteromonas TaxID=53246 RepID=UPI00044E963D|nr:MULTISPECIES: DUF2986 domain-containing protein [Pseudoalteromonas]EWS97135.1 hypothetical protein BG00_04790 [Pseudoalteromonas sp. SCSIO_11900]MBT2151529.1 DUF2986 domain-containing protein [Pseudoalteromonas tetraodonis]MDX1361227.1 DUF2986 domain-containing protein [Pseudoalteromonas tetraodonis]MDX1727242.1 DUF2986 domain-containing protein [Pseudoalteromonas tetraodonis]TMO21701.1 DUF2986 domain-containing protein [Pseudoalteromonas sp. S4741]